MTFWDKFPRTKCFPDKCNSEYMNVDSLIHQPFACWSSLAYLAPVIALEKKVTDKTAVFRWFQISLVLLAFSSMFCHASFIRLAVAMDFACIVVLMGYFTFTHYTRFEERSQFVRVISYFLFFGFMTAMFYFPEKYTKIALCIGVFPLAFHEVRLTLGKNFWRSKDLLKSVLILFLSFVFFMLDDQKIAFSDPHGWVHGHSIWHLGTAVSIYFFGSWRFIESKRTDFPRT